MIFISLFVTSFLAGSFFPMGSEAHFLYLQDQGESLLGLLISASLGNTLGGMSCYAIARFGGIPLIKKYLKHDEQKLATWEKKLEGKSEFMAMFCWLPFVGELIATALGLVSKRTFKVLTYMYIGKLGRYLILASAFKELKITF